MTKKERQINKSYISEILELLKIKYSKETTRKKKHTYEYYLKMIMKVPDMNITWYNLA
jgi:hypothetical protein